MDEYKSLKKYMNKNSNNNTSNKKYTKKIFGFINTLLFTILIFVVNLILCKQNLDYKNFIYKYVYSYNFSFSKVEEFINSKLGGIIPNINNKTQEVFNEKISYLSLEEIDNGVKVNINKGDSVNIFESGVVVFIGEKEGLGNTVILEQIDGNEAWYVNVDTSNIKIYDYLEKGNILGSSLSDNYLMYFKNKGEVIDYKKYIS